MMNDKSLTNQKEIEAFFAKARIVSDGDIQTILADNDTKSDIMNHYLTYYQTPTMKNRLLSGRYLFAGAGLFSMLAVLVVGGIFLFSPKQANVKYLNGEIAYVEGNVQLQKAGEPSWIDITNSGAVATGDTVRTIGDSKAIVNLDDGSSVRLSSDTKITFESLASGQFVITNSEGQLYSRVAKGKGTFEVKSGETTYTALGTAFKVFNLEDKKGIVVYESAVEVKDKDNTEKVIAKQGEKYYDENNSKPELKNKIEKFTYEDVKKDKFAIWNKDQDEKNDEFKTAMGILEDEVEATPTVEPTKEVTPTVNPTPTQEPTPKPTTKPTEIAPTTTPTKITLTGKVTSTGVSLSWTTSGFSSDLGYKVVKSTDVNPVYPGNDYQYISDPNQKSTTWKLDSTGTYHFRVCNYLGGKCGLYSNDIKLTFSKGEATATPTTTKSISLKSNGDGTVSWSINGTSSMGFKVVWSKNSNPTYPNRDGDRYQYFSDSSQRKSDELEAFDGSGTYYVRTCEYLGGKCGVYSNQVTVSL